jgi:hypothetical protein
MVSSCPELRYRNGSVQPRNPWRRLCLELQG